MKKVAAAISLFAIVCAPARGEVSEYCAFDDSKFDKNTLVASDPDAVTMKLWLKILTGVGLEEAPFILKSANVPNAVAFVGKRDRTVYYNPELVENVTDNPPDWIASGILAHELGHHQLWHLFTPDQVRKKQEQAADKYAGFTLYGMNANDKNVQAAANSIAYPYESDNYDAPADRAKHFLEGWLRAQAARAKRPESGRPNPVPLMQAMFTPEALWRDGPSGGDTDFVARVVLADRDDEIYLLSTNELVQITKDGTPKIVGERKPPMFPDLAWMYQTRAGLFGVTKAGTIVRPTIEGKLETQGYITSNK